jgi:putative FmdB family regulatory protein
MPTYEYKCPKCGTRFERFQKITAPTTLPCPKCGAVAERLISGGHGLVFKGSGFYETDYKRAGEKTKPDSRKKGDGAPSADKPTTPSKPDASPPSRKADSKAD